MPTFVAKLRRNHPPGHRAHISSSLVWGRECKLLVWGRGFRPRARLIHTRLGAPRWATPTCSQLVPRLCQATSQVKSPDIRGPGHARGASTPQQHQIPLGHRFFLGPPLRHPQCHLPNTQPQGAHEAEGWGKNARAATYVLVPQPPDTQTLRSERPARTSLGHPK